jgi:CRISPR-associated protein Csd1
MLHELKQYAETHKLSGLPGYAAKTARWLIVLEDEQFVDVISAKTDFASCPDLGQPELASQKGRHSHFLLDCLDVVAGFDADPADEKLAAKHSCFVRLLHASAGSCMELEACARVLEDIALLTQINASLHAKRAKASDKVTFMIGTRLAPDMREWREWWDGYRSSLRSKPSATSDQMVCFLTGDIVTPAMTHDNKLKLNSVGGISSGSVMIGFDKEAFKSFGLQQGANAACSTSAAAIYTAALDHLITHAPPPLGGMLMLHWYDRPVDEDPLAYLLPDFGDAEVDEAEALNKARKVLAAVREGTPPEKTGNRYYVLQITGSVGRVMVRDWFNGDFVELVSRINEWFDDLEIVGPHGGDPAPPPRLAGALTRLVSFRPTDTPSDTFKRINAQLGPLVPRLWRAILQGGPLPDAVAQAALGYARSRLLRADDNQQTDNLDRVACAILKAWLIRHPTTEKGNQVMEAKVNPEHPAKAYHAGRMLAVLAAVQTTALGDVGSGVVQRYYAAASATPGLVLGRLVRNAQFHLSKIESKGLSIWYDSLIAQIATKLGDAPPTTLDLEGQTLFALGYYQQRAAMFGGRQHDEAPSTPETAKGGN